MARVRVIEWDFRDEDYMPDVDWYALIDGFIQFRYRKNNYQINIQDDWEIRDLIGSMNERQILTIDMSDSRIFRIT